MATKDTNGTKVVRVFFCWALGGGVKVHGGRGAWRGGFWAAGEPAAGGAGGAGDCVFDFAGVGVRLDLVDRSGGDVDERAVGGGYAGGWLSSSRAAVRAWSGVDSSPLSWRS